MQHRRSWPARYPIPFCLFFVSISGPIPFSLTLPGSPRHHSHSHCAQRPGWPCWPAQWGPGQTSEQARSGANMLSSLSTPVQIIVLCICLSLSRRRPMRSTLFQTVDSQVNQVFCRTWIRNHLLRASAYSHAVISPSRQMLAMSSRHGQPPWHNHNARTAVM